ncbi:MAG: rod shape-determining protein MreC [candidate division WOR-3 bacterium]
MAARTRTTWHDRGCWLLLGAALGLLVIPRPFRLKVSLPLQTVLLAPLRATAWFRQNLTDLAAENRRLTQLASELAIENARLTARSSGDQSKVPATGLPIIYCPIIGRDMSTLGRFLIVSRGASHGVIPGACAMTADGVAGRVIAAGPNQALVQTLLDPDSRIAVVNRRSGALAVARPENRLLILDYVPDTAGMALGDTLLTSGLGLVFPRGLRVGTITSLAGPRSGMFRHTEVKPFVDILKLEGIFVLIRQQPAGDHNGWLESLAPPEVNIPTETAR